MKTSKKNELDEMLKMLDKTTLQPGRKNQIVIKRTPHVRGIVDHVSQ